MCACVSVSESASNETKTMQINEEIVVALAAATFFGIYFRTSRSWIDGIVDASTIELIKWWCIYR